MTPRRRYFALLVAAAVPTCSLDDPRLEPKLRLPPTPTAEATSWPSHVPPPDWAPGRTWMVKERCYWAHDFRQVESVDPRGGPAYDWPVYAFYRVEAATEDGFTIYYRAQEAELASYEPERHTEFWATFGRRPFQLTGWRGEAAGPGRDWTQGPCMVIRGAATWCPLRAPAELGPGADSSSWFVSQHIFTDEGGAWFYYWHGFAGPAALYWRRGEPYWEDSLGCNKLVRKPDGTVHQPTDWQDRGPTEPAVVTGTPPTLRKEGPTNVFEPTWKVGDTWMTKHLCPRNSETTNPFFANVPPKPPVVDRPTYAFYAVTEVTDEVFRLKETKVLVPTRPRTLRFPDEWDLTTIVHTIRRHPFGVYRWKRIQDDRTVEYRGGPCLNSDARVDLCPFPMPAEPPEDGHIPSEWIAEQTVRPVADGVELDYRARDGKQATLRWKRNEPWPEAVGSCLRLMRNADGTVFRPERVEDYGADYWSSPESKFEERRE